MESAPIQAFSNSELAERSAHQARAERNWDCKPTHFDYQSLTRFLRVVLEAGVELMLIDDQVESVAPDLHSWWGVRIETALEHLAAACEAGGGFDEDVEIQVPARLYQCRVNTTG